MCYKTILIAVLSFMQIIPSAFAADPDSSMGGGDSESPYSLLGESGPQRSLSKDRFSLNGETTSEGRGAEYISGDYPGAVLMPVQVWGAVTKSGIHEVPTGTDLSTMLSLAGGPAADSNIHEIIIKRQSKEKPEVIKVDMEEIMLNPAARTPVLAANDVVLIPHEKDMVSKNTVAVITVVATLASTILTAIVISQSLKNH